MLKHDAANICICIYINTVNLDGITSDHFFFLLFAFLKKKKKLDLQISMPFDFVDICTVMHV